MSFKSLLVLLFGSIAYSSSYSQEAVQTRPSPLAIVSCRYKDSYLKIIYSQPHKRGREIFGSLVPYGQVWRTGANEATELTLTKEVFINGQLLSAGTYSLFTIPEKEKWTVILNKDVGLWGSYNYNPQMDVLRFEVSTQAVAPPVVYEPFTIQIDQRNNKADIVLMWDQTRITFPVDFIEPKP